VSLDKTNEPFLVLRTNANEALPRISPDGKLLAYQSDTSGRWEVHVLRFPRGEGGIQISVGGGQHPMWNPRGGEIFYVSGNDLMAADMVATPALRAGTPRRAFSGDALGTRLSVPTMLERRYAVFPDGRRFVVVRGNGAGTSDVVLVDGLLARAGPDARR
jgi:dipeptidyl aminopeptidase/acylaminoacyl peptidase